MACGVRQVVSSDSCFVRVSVGYLSLGETSYPASRDSIGPSPDGQRIHSVFVTYPSNSRIHFLSANRYDVNVASLACFVARASLCHNTKDIMHQDVEGNEVADRAAKRAALDTRATSPRLLLPKCLHRSPPAGISTEKQRYREEILVLWAKQWQRPNDTRACCVLTRRPLLNAF